MRCCFVEYAKVAQSNANQTKTLIGGRIYALSQRESNAGEFLA